MKSQAWSMNRLFAIRRCAATMPEPVIMFESVAPEAFVRRSHRIFYQTLPVSVTAHVLVAAAFVGHMLWRGGWPVPPPALRRPDNPADAPPPPPPPPPPPR